MYAGMELNAALSPAGTMKKSVPAAMNVMIKEERAEGGTRKDEEPGAEG